MISIAGITAIAAIFILFVLYSSRSRYPSIYRFVLCTLDLQCFHYILVLFTIHICRRLVNGFHILFQALHSHFHLLQPVWCNYLQAHLCGEFLQKRLVRERTALKCPSQWVFKLIQSTAHFINKKIQNLIVWHNSIVFFADGFFNGPRAVGEILI